MTNDRRMPQRPQPKAEPQLAAITAPEPAPIADGPGRRRRVVFGQQPKKLDAPKRPGFVRRWVNDEPGRIEYLKDRGYELVLDEATRKPVTTIVGVAKFGGGLTAHLMEIPEEFYREDMEAKDAPLKQFDADLRRGSVHGTPGKDGRYVPTDAYGQPKISVRDSK